MRANALAVNLLAILAALWSVGAAHATYDPALGRWIERDPVGYDGGDNRGNLYQYALANPGLMKDSLGLRASGGVAPDIVAGHQAALHTSANEESSDGDTESQFRACASDRDKCYLGCVVHFEGGEGSYDPRCLARCNSRYRYCVDKVIGNFRPLPSTSSECDNYAEDDYYNGARTRCFCKCAGDSQWAIYVRGCLRHLYERGVSPAVAHEICFDGAKNRQLPEPTVTLGWCFAYCSYFADIARCHP